MISYYLAHISPSIPSNGINVPTLIGLGVAMNLLRTHEVREGGHTDIYFAPAESAAANRPFHHSRLLYLEGQRAAHVSVLLAIPQAQAVLIDFGKTE